MTELEYLKMMEAQFVLLDKLARSNPIYIFDPETGKKSRQSLSTVCIIECKAALVSVRERIGGLL
jgi:hypothetical protein